MFHIFRKKGKISGDQELFSLSYNMALFFLPRLHSILDTGMWIPVEIRKKYTEVEARKEWNNILKTIIIGLQDIVREEEHYNKWFYINTIEANTYNKEHKVGLLVTYKMISKRKRNRSLRLFIKYFLDK